MAFVGVLFINATESKKDTSKAKNLVPDIKIAIQNANALVLNNLSEEKIADLYSTLKIMEQNLSTFKNQTCHE